MSLTPYKRFSLKDKIAAQEKKERAAREEELIEDEDFDEDLDAEADAEAKGRDKQVKKKNHGKG